MGSIKLSSDLFKKIINKSEECFGIVKKYRSIIDSLQTDYSKLELEKQQLEEQNKELQKTLKNQLILEKTYLEKIVELKDKMQLSLLNNRADKFILEQQIGRILDEET